MTARNFKWTLCAGGFLLAASIVVACLAGFRMLDASRWVAHTFEVMAELQSVVSGVKDAESGARYYVITGREDFLGRYEDAGSQAERSLERLAHLVSDNPTQVQRLDRLRALSDGSLAFLDALVEKRRREGFEAARRLILARGPANAEGTRLLAEEMQGEEKRLLSVRFARETDYIRQAIAAVCGLSLTLSAMLLAILVLFVSEGRAAATGREALSRR